MVWAVTERKYSCACRYKKKGLKQSVGIGNILRIYGSDVKGKRKNKGKRASPDLKRECWVVQRAANSAACR